MTGFAEMFQQAVALHGRGQLLQAEAMYRDILGRTPEHFDAMHLLGVICHQTGRHAAAAELMRGAIAIDPGRPGAHSNLGLALQALKRPEEALACYDHALLLDPGFAEALGNRGNALRDLGRNREALDSYDRALAIKPDSSTVLNNRGMTLRDMGRLEDALASFDRALGIKPDYAQAQLNRGIALLELGRPEDALGAFASALEISPADPVAMCNRGNALLALGRPAEALESYDLAVAQAPGFAEAHNNRGNALRALRRYPEALEAFEGSLSLKPAFAGALNNRAIVLRELDRYEEALVSIDHALAIDPSYTDALCNRGNVLQDLKRIKEALASYDHALRIDPGHAESHWNESLCRLLVGDFTRGWEKYEWRWETEQKGTARTFAQPLWLGAEDLAGRTILLHAEQGLGDTLQFCRYARQVAALGATVILEVQKPLRTLVAGLAGVSRLVVAGETLPDFDFHCPLLSLPLAFRTTLESVPGEPGGYLRCEPGAVESWRKRLGPGALPRIGLVWDSNSPRRAVPLAEMLKLVSGKAQFYSLQQDPSPEDRKLLAERPEVQHSGEVHRNFSDAPLVELMDLVITADTSMAHVAGALGKKVWIVLGYSPEWRWMLDREDSPWYPSARLFRSPKAGGWAEAIEGVGDALQVELGQR